MSSPPAIIIERMSAVSIAVTARARTSVPRGSPTRCATTSAWWTAAMTAPTRAAPHSTASTAPTPATAAAASRASAARGTSQVQLARRLEFIDAAVGHQGEEKPAVLHDVGADVRQLLDDLVVERPWRAHRPRDGHRAELDLARPGGFPAAAAAVAVDARVHDAVGGKGQRVLGPVVGRQHGPVAALELHQLPRGTAKRCNRALRLRLGTRECSERDKQDQAAHSSPPEVARGYVGYPYRSIDARAGGLH